MTQLAVVTAAVKQGAEPTRVLYFADPDRFVLLDADAPEEPDEDDTALDVLCVHCLLEHHPDAGRGMDLARQHGEARIEEGAWCC